MKPHHLGPLVLLCLGLAGCTPSGSGGAIPSPVVIELPDYSGATTKTNTSIAAQIVEGYVLVDFDDDLVLADIDALLEANGLMRVGWISDINYGTARITNGRSEVETNAALQSVDGVSNAVLNYVLFSQSISGAGKPITTPRGAQVEETLSDVELFANWPHYVMDTFPAHALVDQVLGGSIPSVTIAIVDQGGFQSQSDSSRADGSFFEPGLADTDLAPWLVDPVGIEVTDPGASMRTAALTFVVGAPTVLVNPLLASPTTSLHGLQVASVAASHGQDLIGVGRHARFMPVRVSAAADAFGRCADDPMMPCVPGDPADPCPGGSGCVPGAPVDFFVAGLMSLANNLDSTLGTAKAESVKVVNLSVGTDIDPDDRPALNGFLAPVIERLIARDRVVVMSADDSPGDTQAFAPSFLAPRRGSRRAAGMDRGLMLVAGTRLPDADVFQLATSGYVEFAGLDFVDKDEAPWASSASGDNVSVSAPAEYIAVLSDDFSTREMHDGNSFATPMVAGLAAEMFAADPSATNLEVVQIIEATADRINGSANSVGHGRINCWKALLRLLNRDDLANPKWVGVRFRYPLAISPLAKIFLNCEQTTGGASDSNCTEISDLIWRRVPDVPPQMDSNAREVPSASAMPASLSASFSFSTDELDDQPGGIGIIDVREPGGAVLYQMPWRLGDLIDDDDAFPIDTAVDDFVVTFDVRRDVAAIYGRVVDENGQPISGANVGYISDLFQSSTAETDGDGYYVIYDALAGQTFELTASSPGYTSEIVDVSVAVRRMVREDFELAPAEDSLCDLGTGLDRIRFTAEEGVTGDVAEIKPNGSRTSLDSGMIDLTLDTAACTLSGESLTVYQDSTCGTTVTTRRRWDSQLRSDSDADRLLLEVSATIISRDIQPAATSDASCVNETPRAETVYMDVSLTAKDLDGRRISMFEIDGPGSNTFRGVFGVIVRTNP